MTCVVCGRLDAFDHAYGDTCRTSIEGHSAEEEAECYRLGYLRLLAERELPLPDYLRNHLLYVHPRPWRVGSKVARNVYDGNSEGVAMFTHAHTAAVVVAAVNSLGAGVEQEEPEGAP